MVEFHGLSSFSRLTLKILLISWLLAVIVECADLNKRDVVHRIVLKSARKPRSQKHHHHYQNHGKSNREIRSHKHGHRDYDRSQEFDDSRYVSKEDSRESRRNRSPEDSRESRERFRESRERLRESTRDSRDNSYENSFEAIRQEPRIRQKYPKSYKFNVDFDAEESRVTETSKIRHNSDDWASTVDDVPPPPKIKSKKKSKKYRTPLIDITTSFPVKPPPTEEFSAYEPAYPPFPALPPIPNAFQFNQNTEIPDAPSINPQFPVLQPKPISQFTNFLPIQTTVPTNRNFSNTYEVREKGAFEVQPTNDRLVFQKGKPASFKKTSSHSVGFTISTPPNIGSITQKDIEKLSTPRPTKRRPQTKG